MKVHDLLDSLPALERERLLGRLEGMQMAQRIALNRHEDVQGDPVRRNEAVTVASLIRMIQVGIGSGRMPFGPLSAAEQADIDRIY